MINDNKGIFMDKRLTIKQKVNHENPFWN